MNNKKYISLILLISLLLFSSCQSLIKRIGGNFNDDLIEAKKELSSDAQGFIEKFFAQFGEEDCLIDFHVHAIGAGTHKRKTWVNPEMNSLWPPKEYIKYNVFKSAGGIKSDETADDDYIDRLVRLQRSEPRIGKLLLFAFDYYHTKSGERIIENSTFYVSNDYVLEVSKKYPDVFIPVASLHPYRKDAIKRLEELALKGVKFIKWLPNSQNINPSSKELEAYYRIMKKYSMTLISHTGHEKAVHGEEHQELGNPLHLRVPLKMGVKVIMAHLASLGQCKDYDNQGISASCFDLFWRIISDKKYNQLAFGDMSGTTIHTRIGHPFNKVLEHPELSSRFVNGSDYPLPAINLLYRTKQFVELGYINNKEREVLNEIYHYNPLLFDLISKQTLKHPKRGMRLKKDIFTSQNILECSNDN